MKLSRKVMKLSRKDGRKVLKLSKKDGKKIMKLSRKDGRGSDSRGQYLSLNQTPCV